MSDDLTRFRKEPRPRFYRLEGKKAIGMTLAEYAKCQNPSAPSTIGETLRGSFTISTVFLVVDHQFKPDGDPLIFETLIFYHGIGKNPFGDFEKRYSTYEEAEIGHVQACGLVEDYRFRRDVFFALALVIVLLLYWFFIGRF